MKREEKNQQTRQRILDSALKEFSAKGYEAGSINTICSAGGVSKGIVYHYFRTKDEVYLACVEECFRALTDDIKRNICLDREDAQVHLDAYFNIRLAFFHSHPMYQQIFCGAVIMPPTHLKDEIKVRMAEFDRLNIEILDRFITPLHLRPDISKEEVIDTFRKYQDYINASFQGDAASDIDLHAHEQFCLKALNILLYGMIERK